MGDVTDLAISAAHQRIDLDLSVLAGLVQASLHEALDGVRPNARRRRRIATLQDDIGRRSLRLLTGRASAATERGFAAAAFNRAVLLAALADCADALSRPDCPSALALAKAARRCVADLDAPERVRMRVAALNAAIARARQDGGDVAAARVLEKVGELVCGLKRSQRRQHVAA